MSLPSFRKWWWPLAGALVALVTLLVVMAMSEPFDKRVQRIQPGMTQAEVYAILGPPASEKWEPDVPDHSRATWWTFAEWEPADGQVNVIFYGGVVKDCSVFFEPSLWTRFCRRVGLSL
jgi:SmpA / OmlA family